MRSSRHAASLTTLTALAVFAWGIGPVQSKARNQTSHPAAGHDTRQDLPMPHPSSRRTGGPKHYGHHSSRAGGPQDISGGNGQKLTRQRRF